MKRLWLLLPCLLLISTPTQGKNLRIASLNLKNYLWMDRWIERRYHHEAFKPPEELKALQSAILEIKPDILAVQEIGTETDLERLRKSLNNHGLFYPYTTLVKGPDPIRRLAILSKEPFEKVAHIKRLKVKRFPKSWLIRGLGQVHFRTNSTPWILWVVHFKSHRTVFKSDPKSKKQRENEATKLAEFLVRQHPKATGLLLGDFNDPPHSTTLQHFTEKHAEFFQLIDCRDAQLKNWTLQLRDGSKHTFDLMLAFGGFETYIQQPGHIAKKTQGSDHRLIYIDTDFNPPP